MIKKDEYNEIYLQNGDFGLVYTYKNHGLGNEQIIYPPEIAKIGISKSSDDRVFIKCGRCDAYMDYIHSLKNSYSGKWVCPECGTYVRETTVNKYISELPDIVDTDYDDIY